MFFGLNIFIAFNEGIATKLAEKIGREPCSSAVL